jgi:hypothetical protein
MAQSTAAGRRLPPAHPRAQEKIHRDNDDETEQENPEQDLRDGARNELDIREPKDTGDQSDDQKDKRPP